jgi:hypothetical protein
MCLGFGVFLWGAEKVLKMVWSGGLIDWIEGDTAYMSVVFSWQLDKAYMRAIYLQSSGYHVKVGGPAVMNNPSMFTAFDLTGAPDALARHNPDATFTSRGCIRNCSFCAVPKIEGHLVELSDWKVKPIICDNNLLACSNKHFDKVIDRLLEHKIAGIDFNQGLDARLLTDHHASRLSELPRDTIIRLAWDNLKTETKYREAFDRLVSRGIKRQQIRVYVLIGYKDTPEDARYRLDTVREMGALPNPMRYQPLNAKRKNSYIANSWTYDLLGKYMRYYSRLNYMGGFTFDEYKHHGKPIATSKGQRSLRI